MPSSTRSAAATSALPAQPAPPAQPALAALKSLALPGLGQWHNGEINKAIWCFLAFAFLTVPAVALAALYLPPGWTAPTLALGLLLALGLWGASVWDAWAVARRSARPAALGHPSTDTMAPMADRAPPPPLPFWRLSGVTVLILVLCDFIALPLLTAAVRAHQVQAFRIPSASMAPTLWPGDFVFADMRYACVGCRRPVRRGDVVVFAYPNDRTVLYVKRIVALPGDRVQIEGGEVRVDGQPVASAAGPAPPLPAIPIPSAGVMTRPLAPAADFTVPPGQVFALGDHRASSTDSRHFGTVPLQDIVGRVRQVWFSWGEGGVRWARLGRLVE